MLRNAKNKGLTYRFLEETRGLNDRSDTRYDKECL